jgi:hypothetical protein
MTALQVRNQKKESFQQLTNVLQDIRAYIFEYYLEDERERDVCSDENFYCP